MCRSKEKTNLATRRVLTAHSSRGIVRPATTVWGRVLQKVGKAFGGPRVLHAEGDLLKLHLQGFPLLADLLYIVHTYTTDRPRETKVEMSYSRQGVFGLKGEFRLFFRRQLKEQVKWKITPCNDGVDLQVECSAAILYRLTARQYFC